MDLRSASDTNVTIIGSQNVYVVCNSTSNRGGCSFLFSRMEDNNMAAMENLYITLCLTATTMESLD